MEAPSLLTQLMSPLSGNPGGVPSAFRSSGRAGEGAGTSGPGGFQIVEVRGLCHFVRVIVGTAALGGPAGWWSSPQLQPRLCSLTYSVYCVCFPDFGF